MESARQYFLAGAKYDVFYVVMTDAVPPVSKHARVTYVYRRDFGWPLTAMLRYRSFLDCWHLLAHAHFVFRYACSEDTAGRSVWCCCVRAFGGISCFISYKVDGSTAAYLCPMAISPCPHAACRLFVSLPVSVFVSVPVSAASTWIASSWRP